MLMLASRLPGQMGVPSPMPANGEEWDGRLVACNNGTIAFSVAQAYLYSKPFSGYQWQASGWFIVNPGKCEDIPTGHYHNGSWGSKNSYTLLAFAFYDSTGTWGSFRISPGVASDQQFCVRLEGFGYSRDSPQGDLPRVCDGAQTGYQMIPASFEYTGRSAPATVMGSSGTYELHIKLGPSDRAIPMGKQTSVPSGTQGSSQSSSNAAAKPADYAAAMLRWVREDVNAYIAASATGFEAYKKGDVVVSAGVRSWVSREAPLGSQGCWVIQGDRATTFSCLLSTSTDLDAMRSSYTQLTGDVTASLPAGWKPNAASPFGPEYPASKAYQSSSGAHGEIWIARAATGQYELHYQLVTAESAARLTERRTAPPASTPAPAADDPIGEGGFITPPAPPMQICVSVDFVPAWENPSADPEMEAFRLLVAHYGLDRGKAGDKFRVRSNAFANFERARRAASPSTPLPGSLVDALRAGQRCPESDHLYDLHRPAAAPPK
jgi:hypothetical protein